MRDYKLSKQAFKQLKLLVKNGYQLKTGQAVVGYRTAYPMLAKGTRCDTLLIVSRVNV